MFGRNSPFGFDASSYAESLQSSGFSTMDEVSSQVSGLSRPSAKSIYLQRREYATSINKMMDKFQYRVEHLFTCDLDGRELRNVKDCVERLKLLDQMGRVWGQDMLLEVHGANLLLKDIETKEELESMPLSDVQEIKAVLNSGVFNSLLILSVQPKRKRLTTIFMFQSDDVRADYVQRDLLRALSRRREDSGIRSNTGPTAEQNRVKAIHRTAAPSGPPEREFMDDPVPHWTDADYDDVPEPELVLPQEEEIPSPQPSFTEGEPVVSHRPYTELDRSVDILNHILNDVEIFMGRISAVEAKNTKKKKKKKKGKAIEGMPPEEEFKECLHKIKFGFNLLAELNGQINNPSAGEFVHSLFSVLRFVVSHCSELLPPTIVAPLFTPQTLRFMSDEASPEEDELWQSLGEAWNIPSTQWPEDDEDIPTYTLAFFDGWQPPEITPAPEYSEIVSRQDSPQPEHRQTSANQTPPRPSQKARSGESNLRPMRVKSDFISRNHQELTVRKGEIVQLLDMSKQWWKVRNSRGEEGFVPNNVLEDPNKQSDEEIEASPVLTKKSKPAEVKAWLEDKGFSKITVRCLGVLSGSMLLSMSREELKAVCPEEGGRVFFQLQAVKSSLATLHMNLIRSIRICKRVAVHLKQ